MINERKQSCHLSTVETIVAFQQYKLHCGSDKKLYFGKSTAWKGLENF
jgi:hypothetical protein